MATLRERARSTAVPPPYRDDLQEAIDRTRSLDALTTRGLRLLGGAGALQRGLIRQTAKNGLGMSLEELHEEVLRAALLLAELAEGDLTLDETRPGIRRWRWTVVQTVQFVESLEHLVDTYAKTPEQKARFMRFAREELANARALSDVLERLAEHGL